MNQQMLQLENVHTYYGECSVLKGIHLKIEKGSVVALLGRNGMGKTTTIRSIIGFNPPRSGSIKFRGEEISGIPANKIARKGIGLVPQGRHIFPSLTVRENLLIGKHQKKEESGWTLGKIYDLFPVLKDRAKVFGTSLSGGEQQMLALARALMTDPDLILLDEPTEGLAPIIVQKIADIIKDIKRHGTSILVVEQNLNFSLEIADFIYVLSSGQIVAEITPEELQADEELKSKHLGVGH